MNKERYKKIRKEKDFLFMYYKEEGGTLDAQSFPGILSIWIVRMGVNPQHGIAQITNFLDEKFGQVKSNA